MSTLKFKCTLLTDVILNQHAATEGNQSTLDFIPGNNFLGIVAGNVYAEHRDLALDILHSGKVRFGDAHPALNGVRSLRVPSCFFYPKLGSYKEECYVHHGIPNLASDDLKKKQLKQCRNGFLAFNDSKSSFTDVVPEKFFAIKSAHDREKFRSKDSQMYGYESLRKGLELFFEVEVDDSLATDVKELVSSLLVGKKRVGRSKTAQYGLVEIETVDYAEPVVEKRNDDYVIVYADARLIFFDEYGMPTFTPTADQLGCAGGEIVWEKSQVRTFQYSPWNFKRQSRDMDRCGIEKGSVFVVRGVKDFSGTSCYVGEFKNEGFGKVIYNPKFLSYDGQGAASYAYEKASEPDAQNSSLSAKRPACDSVLLNYLKREQRKFNGQSRIYACVNKFVSDESIYWCGEESFANQWGTIRSIASRLNSRTEIMGELFNSEKAYLEHGVAAEKWNENSREARLKDFLESTAKQEGFSDMEFKSLVVNLASEMAKKIQGGV